MSACGGVVAGGTLSGVGGGVGGPAILANVRITADVTNNALLIYANQENYRLIESTLRQLDRPQMQVSVDATIAEVTLNNDLSYGVQFFLKSGDIGCGEQQGLGHPQQYRAAADVIGALLAGLQFPARLRGRAAPDHRRAAAASPTSRCCRRPRWS